VYDIDEVSLAAIMAEWPSADDYATRVNSLVKGSTCAGAASGTFGWTGGEGDTGMAVGERAKAGGLPGGGGTC
jgi:hypothetical protein